MGIALGLVEAVPRWERVLFRFNECHSDRLCIRMDLYAEHVVDLASRATAGLPGDDFDASGGFLTANQILGPATSVDGRVDEFRSRVRLAVTSGASLQQNSHCTCSRVNVQVRRAAWVRKRAFGPVVGEERGALLGVVAAAFVEPRRSGIGMAKTEVGVFKWHASGDPAVAVVERNE